MKSVSTIERANMSLIAVYVRLVRYGRDRGLRILWIFGAPCLHFCLPLLVLPVSFGHLNDNELIPTCTGNIFGDFPLQFLPLFLYSILHLFAVGTVRHLGSFLICFRCRHPSRWPCAFRFSWPAMGPHHGAQWRWCVASGEIVCRTLAPTQNQQNPWGW